MFSKYDKSYPYLIACSGGPDSMALLGMLLKDSFNIIIAHVNYKTRDESDAEEAMVKEFANKHNLKCYEDYFDHNYKGSFEDAARKFRYNFFAKIYEKENCKGLFVGHHKDDVLETYLLKKQRNVVNESYLINEKTIINKMNVYRPLIHNYYKNDLLNYCKNNNIPYGIDHTNFMDIHPRNVIRKKLESMDKDEVFANALKEEQVLKDTRKQVKEYLRYYPKYLTIHLKDKSDLFLMIFLHEYCDRRYKKFINKSVLLKLKEFIKSDKSNLYHLISNNYYLEKNYDVISYNYRKNEDFCYKFDKLTYCSTSHFKLTDNGLKMEGIYVTEDDFPIIIRNYKSDDKVKLKEGTKKVSRLFIDKKVPLLERKMVPVIVNKNDEVIFVYKIYRKYGYKYVKNNLFMIK